MATPGYCQWNSPNTWVVAIQPQSRHDGVSLDDTAEVLVGTRMGVSRVDTASITIWNDIIGAAK